MKVLLSFFFFFIYLQTFSLKRFVGYYLPKDMGNCMTIMHSAKTKSMTSTSSAEQAYNERRMPSAEELSTTLNPSVGPNQITVDIRREFHNEETSTYWLPKDEDEQKRLTGVSLEIGRWIQTHDWFP